MSSETTNTFKRIYPHLLVVLGFIVVALLYFSPVLSNKVIYQSDIVQYTGMAKEQIDFREQVKEEPYWTNSAFGGMPTYQLGAKFPHNYVKDLDSLIRFLPRPADYLFIYFIGFYILLASLGMKPLRSFIGALAFGFSTYLIIILGVGHNAKAHAIAYMPMVLAGVLLVFRKHYIKGGLLTLFAAALEISANHFQMTYYLLLLLIVVGVFYMVKYIREKDYKAIGTSIAVLVGAAILSIGANATNLMATSEYTKFSTRSNSELTYQPDGSVKESSNAMSYDYITEYSYGIFESLNLIAPRLTGGANNEHLDTDSNVYKLFKSVGASDQQAKEMASSSPTYWGDQPIVAAPAYIGAVVFFLFLIGIFAEKRSIKYVFIIGAVFSLLLSWGKNFSILTDFFINYFPLYNKFRAVSSIQVILELCVPALAIIGLYAYSKLAKEEQLSVLKKSGIVAGSILILLFLVKGSLSFAGLNDGYYRGAYGEIGPGFISALIEDRKAMYTADLIRSFVLIALAAGALFLSTKEKIKPVVAVIIIGVLMVGDLVLVDRKYVNDSNFVLASQMSQPFQATPADKVILNDTEHFRVYELNGGFNSARSSFFHHSLGGYHAAKPRRMQELADYQLNQHSNMEVLNMMNVKYIIQKDEEGRDVPLLNDNANGNAWFVSSIQKVQDANEEMKALDKLKTKNQAVLNTTMFKDVQLKDTYAVDSLARIELKSYAPNKIVYESTNSADGVAVFSEIYYPQGWIAKVDNTEVPIFAVDYVLRGIELSKGKHTIEFTFEPQVIKTGSRIALGSSILIFLITIGGVYLLVKKKE
ncbi:YfhO family protein [Myroides odoratimimus]|uniref:YfhO family protein n=1 Tax=Myroides odoratimimus TaxID=76832 RepID=UPI002DB5F2A6|nr:YfhO family protein [Myroides odoratimimus]MEC4054224.1 YfhO family protein [Myroides odoratimimus]